MSFLEKIDGAVGSVASLLTNSPNRAPVKAALYFFLAFFAVGIPYAIVNHIQTSGFHMVSVEREKKVGSKEAARIEKRVTLVPPTDERAAYVAEIGRRIAERNNPWNAEFDFGIIEDDRMINAFALPGGRIYITTGMLSRLESEAELAAVLAHEVAHVSHRHYARNIGRQMMTSWVKKFLGGTDKTILKAGSFVTTNIAFLKMRQEDELEADYFGTMYIYDLNYDPSGAVALSKKLLEIEKEAPDFVRALALTHPPSVERVKAMAALSETLPKKDGLILGEQRYKTIVAPKRHSAREYKLKLPAGLLPPRAPAKKPDSGS